MFGFTPLMEAAASGHEIIVQYLLDRVSVCMHVYLHAVFTGKFQMIWSCVASCVFVCVCVLQGARVEERNFRGETSRVLAMMYGHTKIASLIDMHCLRAKTGHLQIHTVYMFI